MNSENNNHADSRTPFVSVIIPTLNEEKHIVKCIESLENSDYAMEKLELLVVDGGSIDNTVNLVEVLQEKYSNIRLIPVEGANTAVGRNIAVRNANGDMIFNFSSHAYVETNTIKILALKLQNSEKQVVGVGCKDKLPLDQSSLVARGVDAITNTVLGGSLMHQHAVLKDERYFDSISFTIYRKEIFGKIGFFCPGLPAGDDAEFNLRIKKSGYRLLYTPETCVYRYSRENIKSFFWQMFRYGKNRMEINKIHACLKPAHLVPFLFIMYFFSPIVLVTFSIWSWLALWGLGLLLYSMTICLFSAKISIHTRMFRLFFVSIALYITEHFAYGTGTVAGIVSTKPIANKDVLNNES